MRRSLHCAALLLALVACAHSAALPPGAPELSRDELQAGMAPGCLFHCHPGDGTPLGDSLAKIVSTAEGEIEGGDARLGDRLLRYAIARGWSPDSLGRGDVLAFVNVTPEPAAWITVIEARVARDSTAAWLLPGRDRLRRRL